MHGWTTSGNYRMNRNNHLTGAGVLKGRQENLFLYALIISLLWTLLVAISLIAEYQQHLNKISLIEEIMAKAALGSSRVVISPIQLIIMEGMRLLTILHIGAWFTGMAVIWGGKWKLFRMIESIRGERNNFKTLFDTAPVGMLLLNSRYEIVSANLAMGRILNKDPLTLSGSRCGDLLNCLNSQKNPQGCGYSTDCSSCSIMRGIRDAFAACTATSGDESTVHIKGAPSEVAMTIRFSIQPVSVDDAPHAVLALDDITLQKQIEHALQQQQEFYEKLLQNLSVPAFVIDPGHRLLIWNRSCEMLTGIPSAEVVGTTEQWRGFYDHARPCLADIVLDGDGDRVSELYKQFQQSPFASDGLQAEGWYTIRGEECYIFFNAVPIRSDTGEIVAVIETLEDITDRKRIEDDLRTLSYAITQSPVSIVITSPQGLIEHVNPKFTEVTGYTEEEVVGRNPSVLKSGQTSEDTYRELWDNLLQGREWRGEFLNKRKNGELYWEDALISPIKGPDGAITHYIGIKEEVTEKKRLEGQLRHAQKMEAVGQLSGGVAHDFNNILTAIIGYASILGFKLEGEGENKGFIDEIIRAAERGARLTQNLLTFSHKQQGTPSRIDMNELVGRVVRIVGRKPTDGISLVSTISEYPLPVMAESIQIEQSVMNLVSNAMEAMADGGGVLGIETDLCHMTREMINRLGYGMIGEYAVVTVSDTGAGMDEDTLKRIYEPFFTTKEIGSGSGLGLSITYGIIKRHKGFIGCISEKGTGSSFQIYLPIAGEGEGSSGG